MTTTWRDPEQQYDQNRIGKENNEKPQLCSQLQQGHEEYVNLLTLLIENTCDEPPMANCFRLAVPTGSREFMNVELGSNCVDNLDGARYGSWLGVKQLSYDPRSVPFTLWSYQFGFARLSCSRSCTIPEFADTLSGN